MHLIWPFLLIVVARICDVSMGTLRVAFIARGRKVFAAACGFVEVLIWISVMEVTSILENLTLLNPDLDDTGFLQIFRRTDDTDDSEDTKHGN